MQATEKLSRGDKDEEAACLPLLPDLPRPC